MANEYRKQAADRIERVFATEDHYAETHDSQQSTLRDILTDLRHYADEFGLDFHQALDGSYQVYLEEIHG